MKSVKSHIELVRLALRLIYNADVTYRLKKFKVFAQKIDYLGHLILLGSFGHAEQTTDAVAKLGHNATQTMVWSDLGLCYVFTWLVPNFASLLALFNQKLRNDQLKKFGSPDDKDTAAVTSSKKALISPSVLTLPKNRSFYTLDTNDCDK